MLKKSEKVDFAFEIHTPDLLDNKNKEGRRVHPQKQLRDKLEIATPASTHEMILTVVALGSRRYNIRTAFPA